MTPNITRAHFETFLVVISTFKIPTHTLQPSHIATSEFFPATPLPNGGKVSVRWCLFPPMVASCSPMVAPDDWCRNPVQHIWSTAMQRTHAVEYIEYILRGLNQPTVGAVHATGRKIISPGDWRTVAGSVTSVTRQSYQWEALASVWCTGQKYQLSRKVLGPTPRSLGAATCWSPFLKPFIFQCTLVLLSACSILYNFAKCIKYFYHWNSEGLTFS